MRRKAANDRTSESPRLFLVKPAPEPLRSDAEALDSILDEGVSYKRLLSRDSLGGERESETVRFKVSLVGGESDFAKKLAKTVLIQFLNERLGKPLRDFGREGEELVCALQEAEDARLVRLKAVSH